MHTTELITPPDGSGAAHTAPPAEQPPLTAVRMFAEPIHLIGFVPVAGPPAMLLAGPLVLLSAILAGPFLALLTIVVLLIAATIVAALAGALLASPYLLVRHLRGRRSTARTRSATPAPQLVPIRSRQAAA